MCTQAVVVHCLHSTTEKAPLRTEFLSPSLSLRNITPILTVPGLQNRGPFCPDNLMVRKTCFPSPKLNTLAQVVPSHGSPPT